MEGVRQGCVLCLIVLCCYASKGAGLAIRVPGNIEVYRGKDVTAGIAYGPNSTKDEIFIKVAKTSINHIPVLNISSNGSKPTVSFASGWTSKIRVQQRYNNFLLTFRNVQLEYNGAYSVTVEVNGETKEGRMFVHVLELPSSVNIEILNASIGPYEEHTLVNFSCTGIGGRGVGEITLAEKYADGVNYFPLNADLVESTENDLTLGFNYTFQIELVRQNNGSEYVCAIYKTSHFLENGILLRSEPVTVQVKWQLHEAVGSYTKLYQGDTDYAFLDGYAVDRISV